MGRFVPGVTLR